MSKQKVYNFNECLTISEPNKRVVVEIVKKDPHAWSYINTPIEIIYEDNPELHKKYGDYFVCWDVKCLYGLDKYMKQNLFIEFWSDVVANKKGWYDGCNYSNVAYATFNKNNNRAYEVHILNLMELKKHDSEIKKYKMADIQNTRWITRGIWIGIEQLHKWDCLIDVNKNKDNTKYFTVI